MIIHYNPDEYETVVKHHTCVYHEKHPRHPSYAGCTCWTSYMQRRKTDGEQA